MFSPHPPLPPPPSSLTPHSSTLLADPCSLPLDTLSPPTLLVSTLVHGCIVAYTAHTPLRRPQSQVITNRPLRRVRSPALLSIWAGPELARAIIVATITIAITPRIQSNHRHPCRSGPSRPRIHTPSALTRPAHPTSASLARNDHAPSLSSLYPVRSDQDPTCPPRQYA